MVQNALITSGEDKADRFHGPAIKALRKSWSVSLKVDGKEDIRRDAEQRADRSDNKGGFCYARHAECTTADIVAN